MKNGIIERLIRCAFAPCALMLAFAAMPADAQTKAAQTKAAAQTKDDVVLRNAEARGGLDKLRSIQTMVIHGRLVGPGLDATIVVRLKRKNQIRTELGVGGKVLIQAFDGNV